MGSITADLLRHSCIIVSRYLIRTDLNWNYLLGSNHINSEGTWETEPEQPGEIFQNKPLPPKMENDKKKITSVYNNGIKITLLQYASPAEIRCNERKMLYYHWALPTAKRIKMQPRKILLCHKSSFIQTCKSQTTLKQQGTRHWIHLLKSCKHCTEQQSLVSQYWGYIFNLWLNTNDFHTVLQKTYRSHWPYILRRQKGWCLHLNTND